MRLRSQRTNQTFANANEERSPDAFRHTSEVITIVQSLLVAHGLEAIGQEMVGKYDVSNGKWPATPREDSKGSSLRTLREGRHGRRYVREILQRKTTLQEAGSTNTGKAYN